MSELVKQFHVQLYLFCLMTNHFHLVCETPEGNLSRFMQAGSGSAVSKQLRRLPARIADNRKINR